MTMWGNFWWVSATYQISVLPGQKYSVSPKKVGRFYTVIREKLKDYR